MKALALVEAPDHVCCRYRIRAFAPALDAAGWSLTVEGLARGPLARARQLRGAAGFDAVVVQRKLMPGWQVALLRRSARRLLFDFDDAVLYRDSYDARGPRCPRRGARFTRIARAADRVLAGNAFLAERARMVGARSIEVVPTCVDPDLYTPKSAADARAGRLDLVWIGSSSTLQGLELQRPLLERLGRELPGVRLRLVCDRFPRFDPLGVVAVPWTEAGEGRELAAGDVGISWVPDDLWSRGKCGLKLLQYRAAGLPVVTNPVGVHPEIVADGRDGFLASGDDEWVAALRTLRDDPALRARMGRAAREDVERRYAASAWGPVFVAALSGDAMPSPRGPHRAKARQGSGSRGIS